MTMKPFALGVAAALLLAGCATREPMPFKAATDCFYPSCSLDVEVVDDGKGGKQLKVTDDGNIRMGTRHKVVAIVWNLRTPGYEFRNSSVGPHTARSAVGKPITPPGVWSQEIYWHPVNFDSISVTNLNNDRRVLYYDLTVYPSRGTPGGPLTLDAAIMNDHCPDDGTRCR